MWGWPGVAPAAAAVHRPAGPWQGQVDSADAAGIVNGGACE